MIVAYVGLVSIRATPTRICSGYVDGSHANLQWICREHLPTELYIFLSNFLIVARTLGWFDHCA